MFLYPEVICGSKNISENKIKKLSNKIVTLWVTAMLLKKPDIVEAIKIDVRFAKTKHSTNINHPLKPIKAIWSPIGIVLLRLKNCEVITIEIIDNKLPIIPTNKKTVQTEIKKLNLLTPAECILLKKTEFFHSDIVILTINIKNNDGAKNIANKSGGVIKVEPIYILKIKSKTDTNEGSMKQ
ncbi:hypothetical protein [Mesoplasma corruscae]|uniref:Uncharacterized protein n=1 Tax=Mesoplasma corruscae TaxID=216874 RepID=A0A2S5RGJ7_9MOLU|nr:hypothetical protein [Mesoplasma corruscae]PPE06245.1 hypothetical protein MCORR_v1c05490 [Mesoplasma corruscae]